MAMSKEYGQFLKDNAKAKAELNLEVGTEYIGRDVFGRLFTAKVDRVTPSGVEMIFERPGWRIMLPEWATTFIGLKRCMDRL